MNQEQSESKSPFAALTWQEQQDRWLAWRSRQLDYQPAGSVSASEEGPHPTDQRPDMRRYEAAGLPRMRLPNMRIAAPTRHQELDQVIERHRQALKRAGSFQTTAID